MLFFLSLAAKQNWIVDTYEDKATGVLEKNEAGKLAMTKVTLYPVIKYSGPAPTLKQEAYIHHLAYQECFIASSVTTLIEIKSRS